MTSVDLSKTLQGLLDVPVDVPVNVDVDLNVRDNHDHNDHDHYDDNDVMEDNFPQGIGEWCAKLASELEVAIIEAHVSNSNSNGNSNSNNSNSANLRDLLGDQMQIGSQLGPRLLPLLQDRVDNSSASGNINININISYTQEALMMDVNDVNQDGMPTNTSATATTTATTSTLTRTSIQAAWLYARLLSCPGALGSGLVDVALVSALTALIRRWALECCGRESMLLLLQLRHECPGITTTTTTPSKSPLKKKSRRQTEIEMEKYDLSEEEDSYATTTTASTANIWSIGLSCIAPAVCAILQQKEFATSWSYEAREAILEAVTTILGTTAALQSTFRSAHDGLDQHVMHVTQITQITQQASQGLLTCICHTIQGSSNTIQRTTTTTQHETTILVCRGLLHLLQFKEIVPNGEKGKQDAHEAATIALQDLIEGYNRAATTTSNTYSTNTQTKRRRSHSTGQRHALTDKKNTNATTTPSALGRRRSSMGSLNGSAGSKGDDTNTTPSTLLKTPSRSRSRSRRRSTVQAPGTNVSTILSPAALKKNRQSSSFDNIMTPNGNIMTSSSTFVNKPRPVWSIFVGLLQKLATTSGMERANARHPIVNAILKCIPALPLSERTYMLRTFLKLIKSKVSLHRLVSCEVVGQILSSDWIQSHQDDMIVVIEGANNNKSTTTTTMNHSNDIQQDEEKNQSTTIHISLPNALWYAIQERFVDKLSAIRAKAILSVEHIIVKHNNSSLTTTSTSTTTNLWWLDQPDRLLSNLKKRALRDETATVRKAAIVALKQIFLQLSKVSMTSSEREDTNNGCVLQDILLDETYISTFGEACQDTSLLTRKAAAESITLLLMAYLDHPSVGGLLEQAWCTHVLSMVLDEEVANKAIASFDQVIVEPLLTSSSANMNDVDMDMDTQNSIQVSVAWRILAHVASTSGSQGASKGHRQALQTALFQLAIEDNKRIYENLWNYTIQIAQESLEAQETSETQIIGVWCLTEALLLSTTASNPKNLRNMVKVSRSRGSSRLEYLSRSSWKVLLKRLAFPTSSSNWMHGTLRSSLVVVSKISKGLNDTVREAIYIDLRHELEKMSFSPEVLGAAITALTSISSSLSDATKARSLCKEWIESIYCICEEYLTEGVKNTMTVENSESQKMLTRALFCVGELSMVGFRVDDDDATKTKNQQDNSDILRGIHIAPPPRIQDLVQTLLAPTLPGCSSETPTKIRAHAFTVLGKLCLRDERLAKDSLNLLARELHPNLPNPNPGVQSNALLIIGDLCVRYTNMADRYLPIMASCLQTGTCDPERDILSRTIDPACAITRKHAVLLLSSLLLQDYIKWRGLLFHRFLVACSDEDEDVAQLAENVLSGPLFTRQPKLFFNHFVEAIFVLNKCSAHPIYIAAASHGDGGSGIAVGFEGIYLNGELGRLRRHRMYEFLLSKLSDEEKIGVTARLAKEVLGEAVNSKGDLGQVCEINVDVSELSSKLLSAWNVLTDALAILTSQSIKVGKQSISLDDDIDSSGTGSNVDDPNLPNATRQVSLAKTRLLSKISRKHLIEIVLPILCNLKVKLEASCSSLIGPLMEYLLDIFKLYKQEVKEFLSNDPLLLQELAYDARQYEKQHKISIETS